MAPQVWIGLTAACVFVLDAASKWLVQTRMVPGQSLAVIPGFFYITYVRNAGAAFGLLQGQTALFIAVAIAVVALIATYGRRMARHHTSIGFALGLQLGGAMGNLVDRVVYGRVVDFLDFRIWAFVFNVADAAIVVGGALFAVALWRLAPAEER